MWMNILGITLLVFVAILAIVAIALNIISLLQVDWKNNWKACLRDVIISILVLFVMSFGLNPSVEQTAETYGWFHRYTFYSAGILTMIVSLLWLPFIYMKHAKW